MSRARGASLLIFRRLIWGGEAVNRLGGDDSRRPDPRVHDQCPLSPNEERYVLAETLTAPVYAIPWTYVINGPISAERLQEALEYVCNRHEVLRTGFEPGASGQFTAYVESLAHVVLERRRLKGASSDELREAFSECFYRTPDMTPGSLRRFLLIETGEKEHVFGFSLHHSVSDAQSSRLFITEVFARYAGDEPAAEAVPFGAFWDWDWRNSEAYADALTYWKLTLEDIDEIAPVVDDRASGEGRAAEASIQVKIPAEIVDHAQAAAGKLGVTLFTYFYSICVIAFARMTAEERLCTTFQSNGRRGFEGSAETIGSFSNALILNSLVDETMAIADFVRQMNADIRGAITNELVPYHHVIRETGVHPSFGVNWFPKLPAITVPGLEVSDGDVSDSQSDYDLNLRFVRSDERLDLIIFYRSAGISRDRVFAAAAHVAGLADGFARDLTVPLSAVRSASLAPAGLLPDLTAPLSVGGDDLIYSAFLRNAQADPSRTALVHGVMRYSYGDVEAKSRALAAELAAQGVKRGDRVVILADREPSLIWSMLAVSRLGAIFVVLDSAYPEQRLSALIEICKPNAVLCRKGSALREIAQRLAGGSPLLDTDPPPGEVDIVLDVASPDDQAYFLFTSGSTGTPKCIACSHAPLAHFVRWQAEEFGLNREDRFSMLSGLSHDPLMRDIFAPLSLGATLLIPEQATIREPGRLHRWFSEEGATVAHMTPPLGQVLLSTDRNPKPLARLRHIFWGGDLLRPALLGDVSRLAPNVQHTNFYGSTETPQAAAFFRFDGAMDWKTLPVGKGVAGFQLAIVDEERRQKGVGEVGEIAVRSNLLSLGYVEDGHIVDAAADRARTDGQPEIYFTSDRGFYLPDGNVAILGRQDDQIKVRGYRVDLSEVTTALRAHPAVSDAIALPYGPENDRRIAAFTVDDLGNRRRSPELMTFLGERLPAYMQPHQIEGLGTLPLLPNGKIDRRALQRRAEEVPAQEKATTPATAAEAAIVSSWSSLLRRTDVSPSTSFVSLGGDSLSYVQIFIATEEVVGVLPDNWQFLTISELAAAKRQASRYWSFVDTSMIARAISIVLVVVGHFNVLTFISGATSALFMVSGFIFGGFQLPEVFLKKSAKPIMNMLTKFLIPVVVFSVFLYGWKTFLGKHPQPSLLLFYGNFIDYSILKPPEHNGHQLYLWYIHCAIQIITIFYVSVLLLKWRGGFSIGVQRLCLALFTLGCLGRFVLPGLIYPGFFEHGSIDLHTVNYLPTTHLATFALGAMIAGADTPRVRGWLVALILIYSALTYHFYNSGGWAFILVGGMMLLYARRLPVVKPLGKAVYWLSGASLFIYLMHYQLRAVFRAGSKFLGLPEVPLLNVVAALLVGVGGWLAWQYVSAAVVSRRNGGKVEVANGEVI